MILAVLVLILAVMLFGSAAVTGFIGAILGFIAFCVALFLWSNLLGVDPATGLFLGVVALAAMFGIFFVFARWWDNSPYGHRARLADEKRRRLSDGLPVNHSSTTKGKKQ